MEEAVTDFWHVYSDGTQADIPFDTEEDKLFAWNSVAVCAEIAGVQVWVVTVNDTHLHSLVRGEETRAKRFKSVLQQRLQTQFPDEGIYFTCDAIRTRDETVLLLQVITSGSTWMVPA